MKKIVGLWVCWLACIGTANATIITTYTDLPTWEAAVGGGITTEDFNTFTVDIFAPVDVGAFSIAAVGGFSGDNGIEAYDPNPTDIQSVGQDRNIDGTTYYSGDLDNTVVTLSFDDPILAFGWDYISIGSTDIFTVLGEVIALPSVGDSAPAFFGIVSDTAFNVITISGSDGAFGADNFRFASTASVPEPASLALLALGLAGIGYSRRKNC